MLDTMIYDRLVESHSGLDLVRVLVDLINKGEIQVLTTHIQQDQLAAMSDEAKSAEVCKVFRELPYEVVPTAGIVLGYSRWGMAAFSGGDESEDVFNAVRSEFDNHIKDALIAATAAREADVFVTEDARLWNRFKAATTKCEVWTFDQFRKYILCRHASSESKG